MRIDIGDGESQPTCLEEIEPGDWIMAKIGWPCMGKVIQRGYIPLGKKRIPGFLIKTVKGINDFIDDDSVVILGYRNCMPPEEPCTNTS